MMSKRKMTVEYLREMVKKSFSNVDIDENGKMCVLPLQSLVDTVDLYEKKIAEQKAEIEWLTKEKGKYQEKWQTSYMNELNLQKQVDELKSENTELYKEHTTLIAGSILEKQNTVKDTAKDLIIEFNEWINEHYDVKYDAYCVCIPVDKVSEFLTQKLKEYGVEVE